MDPRLPHTLAPAFAGLFPTPTLDKFTAAARDLEQIPVLLDDDAIYEFDPESLELLARHNAEQRADLRYLVNGAPNRIAKTHEGNLMGHGMTLRLRGWKLWQRRVPAWMRSAL